MNSITDLLFSFRGRISRGPWWGWKAVFVVLNIVLWEAATSYESYVFLAFVLPLLGFVIWGATALDVKRFHDRNKSGWWILIGAVPVIGSLWILVELGFLQGTDGENRYGYRNRFG